MAILKAWKVQRITIDQSATHYNRSQTTISQLYPIYSRISSFRDTSSMDENFIQVANSEICRDNHITPIIFLAEEEPIAYYVKTHSILNTYI
jgi:hypothetical protein